MAARKIRISSTLALPLEALTKTFMVVGQRGSGKTNLGVVMCEEFSAAGLPFVVSDPLGVWSGLRSSRDGKKAGLPVFILGGEKGDAPLEPTAGGIVADAVVGSTSSFVLDLSLMRKGQRIHFMADFCERVFEAKATNRSPLHLMFDEADEVAPQNLRHENGGMAPRLLGAVEDLVRRGRSRGIGFTGITQRPASLNKNVLSQADVMTVFRLAAPQDRAALDEWVKANASREQIDVFTKALPELATGNAFVWSPAWLKEFKRVHIRMRETFDSSATPEVGVVVHGPKVMATVDIQALKERIIATVETKKAEDPKLLRAKIAMLEGKLAAKVEPVLEQVEVAVLELPVAEALKSFVIDYRELLDDMVAAGKPIIDALDRLEGTIPTSVSFTGVRSAPRAVEAGGEREGSLRVVKPRASVPSVKKEALVNKEVVRERETTHPDGVQLKGMEYKVLQTLAARYPHLTSRDHVAILSGYSVSSGGYAQALANLRSMEFINERLPLEITEKGRAVVGSDYSLPSREELLELWYAKVSRMAATVLRVIAESSSILSRSQVAEASGYSESSGGYAQALADIRKLELIAHRENRLSEAFDLVMG